MANFKALGYESDTSEQHTSCIGRWMSLQLPMFLLPMLFIQSMAMRLSVVAKAADLCACTVIWFFFHFVQTKTNTLGKA